MEIAHGEIQVTLNDRDAINGLRRVDAEFERTMDKIEKEEALASVGADLKRLRRDLKEAEALLKKFDKERADAKLTADKRSTAQLLANQKKVVTGVKEEIAAREGVQRGLKGEVDGIKLVEKQQRALNKAVKQQSKEIDAVTHGVTEQRAAVARLQQAYAKAQTEAAKLDRVAGRLGTRLDRRHAQRVDIDKEHAIAQMLDLRAKLEAIGAVPIDIDVDVQDKGHIAKWISSLADTTVRLGPFTTSLKGLGVALTLLGPAIVGVVGALGALTGAVAGAAVALLGLGTAMGAGLLLALPGVIGVMKPLIGEMKAAFTASKAYSDAVRKYGKDSEQAADKLEQLHTVMKNIPPEARKQIKAMGDLGDRFERLTGASRLAFWEGMASGLKTVSALMPQIAARTNELFTNVSQGFQGWMKGLRSAEGKSVIDSIMGNFNKAIPNMMAGLGSLGAAIGRIAASFSRAFAPLSGGFRSWAKGLSDATKNTSSLDSGVDKVVSSLQSLGHWVAAAGRVLAQFFRAAMGPGASSLDRSADSMNRLAASMKTVEGQRGLTDFFEKSISTAQKLWAALKPLAQLFLEWATIMRPLANVALQITAVLGDMVQAFADFGPVRGLLQAAFAIFLTGAIVSRIVAAATAVRALAAAMLGLRGAAAGAAAVQTLSNASLAAATLGVAGRNAAQGTAAMTKGLTALNVASATSEARSTALASKQTVANTAISKGGQAAAASASKWGKIATGVGAASIALTGLSAAVTLPIIGFAALAYGITRLLDKSDQYTEAAQRTVGAARILDKTTGALAENTRNAAGAHSVYARSVLGVKAAQENVNRLVQNGQKGTDEYKLALLDLRDAQNQQGLSLENSNNIMRDAETIAAKRVVSARHLLGKMQMMGAQGEELAYFERMLNRELNTQEAVLLNNARAMKNMGAVTGQAAQQLGSLARQAPKLAMKIALKFDMPADVGAVSRKAGAAIRSGVPKKVVTQIIVDAKGPKDALRDLNRVKITPKRLEIIEKGGDRAIAVLERISGKKLTEKQQNIVERGGLKVLALLEKLIGKKLVRKTQVVRETGIPKVLAGIASIISKNIPDKRFTISARDAATGVINAVISGLGRIVSKSVNINANYTTSGTPHRGGRASGGIFAATGATPDPERIARASSQAGRRSPQDARAGRKVSRPTLLVGEENKPEFVVATNPAYRQRNIGILRQAADALGVGGDGIVSAAGGKGGPQKKKQPNPAYYAPTKLPTAPDPAMKPGKKPRAVAKKRSKNKGKVYKSQNSWSKYIARLKTQQDDWDREVSIRESQVMEPDDFIIEAGKTPVITTPDGDKSGGDPIYAIDQPAVDLFSSQLESVRAAYEQLVRIVTEITRAVPQAINATNSEINVREHSVRQLQEEIRREKAIIQNNTGKRHGSGQTGKEKREQAVAGAQKRLAKAQKQLGKEKEAIGTLKEDRTQFGEDGKEAGFDYREYAGAEQAIKSERAGLQGRAETEKTEANDPGEGAGGGAGGGGGGEGGTGTQDGGISYERQAALADTERAKVLKEFGGNFIVSPGAAPPGGGVAGMAGAGVAGAGLGDGLVGGGVAGQAAAAIAGAEAGKAVAAAAIAPAGGGLSTGQQVNKTVNITNNYQTQPEDPHTWSAGALHEAKALI